MTGIIQAVVVRWRGGDEVRRCLSSLLANAGPLLARVVLVDSGSGDGGAERLTSEFPDVEVIALADNRGFAYAADRGAGDGVEPLLLLLNPDIEVEAGAVDSMVDLLKDPPSSRRRGAVAGGLRRRITTPMATSPPSGDCATRLRSVRCAGIFDTAKGSCRRSTAGCRGVVGASHRVGGPRWPRPHLRARMVGGCGLLRAPPRSPRRTRVSRR